MKTFVAEWVHSVSGHVRKITLLANDPDQAECLSYPKLGMNKQHYIHVSAVMVSSPRDRHHDID